MKYALLFAVFLLLISCNNENKKAEKPVREKPAKAAATTDTSSFIRQKVQSINEVEGLEKEQFEIACPGQTSVEYFRHHGQIVKISAGYHREGDKEVKADYYYDNDKLIFVFEIVRDGPGTDQYTYSSYIQNDKVIRYFMDHGETSCKKCAFSASSKEYKLLKAKTAADITAILCR